MSYQTTSEKQKRSQSIFSASSFLSSCLVLLISLLTTQLWELGASVPTSFILYFYLNSFVLVGKVSRLYIAVARTERRKVCATRNVLICCVGRLKTHPHRATRRRRSSLMIQYQNNFCVHLGSCYIPSEMRTSHAVLCCRGNVTRAGLKQWCVLWTLNVGVSSPS